MKGTATLVSEETYNERKAFILSCILVSKTLIRQLVSTMDKIPQIEPEARQVIELEKQYIKDELAELTELERWRIREGLGKDERYIYPSVRKKLEEKASADHKRSSSTE